MHALTAAHWVYLVGIIAILGTMLWRKNIIVPAVGFTFLTAIVFTHSLAGGLKAIFNASLVSAQQLFNIFLIIALVTAMLGALKSVGADKLMVAPFRPLMRTGHLSFWVLALVTYFISLFFWPTPAVPLIGAVLIPVAIRSGLRPMAVGFVVAVAGQGMALSSDFVIRVAPGLSAKAAGVSADGVANKALIMSLIVGGVALVVGYLSEARSMRHPSEELLAEWERGDLIEEIRNDTELADAPTIGHGPALRGSPEALRVGHPAEATAAAPSVVVAEPETTVGGGGPAAGSNGSHAAGGNGTAGTGASAGTGGTGVVTGNGAGPDHGEPASTGHSDGATLVPPGHNPRVAMAFAIAVPLAYLALIGYLIAGMLQKGAGNSTIGGDAAALVGGIAVLFVFFGALAEGRGTCLERSAEHVVDGLVFAFKAMGVVLPIAGFFFIGNGDFSGQILGIPANSDGSAAGPAFLYDLVLHGQHVIPSNSFITAFGILIIGMVAGLEGSGFSGLPLTGSLSGSLGHVTHMNAETLAAIGQMGNIWSGGGTLVAWSSLIAVAGFARVNVMDLARKCFLPVVLGLVVSTVIAVIFMG